MSGDGSAKAACPANAHYAGQPVNALTGKMVLRFFVVYGGAGRQRSKRQQATLRRAIP